MNVRCSFSVDTLLTSFRTQIFGHTGMKLRGNSASYADYTGFLSLTYLLTFSYNVTYLNEESAVWMVNVISSDSVAESNSTPLFR